MYAHSQVIPEVNKGPGLILEKKYGDCGDGNDDGAILLNWSSVPW